MFQLNARTISCSNQELTLAACLVLTAIASIIACSSQSAKPGSGDAKTSSSPSGSQATAGPAAEPSATAGIQTTGVPGSPRRHDDHQRETTPAARPEVRRRDQGERRAVEALVAAARGAAQGRAQRAVDHDRRRRLRRAEHLRRRHPNAGAGPHRQGGPALHAVPFHRALLADARGADHRPQPSLGGLRRGLGAVHRVPRLQQHHPQGQGHHRPHPQGQRLRHLVVRQGPQHADLHRQPGRTVRPMADRHGLRVFLRVCRRRHQPVGAEPVPQHDGHLSLRRQARLEPHHRPGRRRHRLAEPAQPD